MSGETDSEEELVAELLVCWQESPDRRDPKLVERLCERQPNLVPRLREQIEAIEQIDQLIERLSFHDDLQFAAKGHIVGGPSPEIPGYKILAEVGSGGMGIVYKALQERLNRIVAIKVIRGGRWVSPRELERFEGEAEVLAKIHHHGVVQIYDILEHDGLLCLILEFVNGCSLSESMRDIPLTPVESAAIIHEIAETIAVVHAKGVLHRDIKPANILIQADGRIKITDFGIAKALASGSTHTMSGEVLGTPAYMAPELVLEKRELITERTDVYAIGATLYEMLTRRAPFGGTSIAETFHQVTHDPPLPPHIFASRIPQDLATICLKCLEKDSDRRYQSAQLLQEDLDRFLHGRPILARPVSTLERCQRWCRRNPERAFFRFFSVLALLIIVVGASWFTARLSMTRREVKEKQDALNSEQFHARLNRLRAHIFTRPAGWLDANLKEVASIAPIATTVEKRQELRNEALQLFTQHDVRHHKSLLTGADICRVAHHPTKPILALAENVSVDDRNVLIRLIDTTTLEPIRTVSFNVQDQELFPDEAEGCRSLAFTPSGADLLVGTRRGRVYQFSTDDWYCRRTWNAHADRVMGITFDDNTGMVYTCDRSGEIKGWELDSKADIPPERSITKIHGELFGLQYVNQHLVVSTGRVILHDLRNQNERSMLDGPLQPGAICVRGPFGSTVVVGCGPRLFQLKTEQDHEGTFILREFSDPRSPTPHPYTIEAVAISPDGRFAASCGGNMLKVWDFASGRPIRSTGLIDGAGKAVQFLPNSTSLIVAGEGQVDLYEISTNSVWQTHSVADTTVTTARMSPNGKVLVHAADNARQRYSSQIQRIDLPSREKRDVILPASRSVEELSFHGDSILCLNRKAPEVYVLEEFGDTLTSIRQTSLGNDVECLATDPTDQFIYFSSDDVHASSPGRHPSAVFRLCLASDEITLCWSNVESARHLKRSQILAIAVGHDCYVTASRDGRLRIHSLNGGPVMATQAAPIDITCAKITLKKFLFCGDESGALQLRQLEDGAVLAVKSEHHAKMNCLEATNEGRTLITGCDDGYVCFWQFDPATKTLTPGDRLGPLNGPIRRISASQTGKRVAIVVTGEHATRLLDLDEFENRLKDMGF